MDKPKPGQPIKVTASQAVEVRQVETPAVEAKDPLLDGEDTVEVLAEEGESQQEDPTLAGDEDDLFNDDNSFSSSGNSALRALEEADTDESGTGEEDALLGAAGGSAAETGGAGTLGEDDVDGEEGGATEMGVAQLFKHDCLRCTHLIPDLKPSKYIKARAFKDCHFESGNTECPARGMLIVVGIPVNRIVKKYMAAHIDGNNEEIARINAKLATVDEAQRTLANQAIQSALRDHYRRAA